jgi:hypothetical protein
MGKREELLSLVKRLTNQRLGFAAFHRGGTLIGVIADMEAAPLLGMADALLPAIDIPSVADCQSNVHIVIPTSNCSFSGWKLRLLMFISGEFPTYRIFRVRIRIAYEISRIWKLPRHHQNLMAELSNTEF